MKPTLPTNYVDDIPNPSVEGMRRYQMIYNSDNTVSFKDVTPYDQTGSDFGAGDINATNQAVNESFDKNKLIRDMDAINALTQQGYAPDALALKDVNVSLQNENNESFNFGYLNGVRGFFTNPSRADDCFIPFKLGGLGYIPSTTAEITITLGFKPSVVYIYYKDTQYHRNALTTDSFKMASFCPIGTNSANENWNTTDNGITITENGFKYTPASSPVGDIMYLCG